MDSERLDGVRFEADGPRGRIVIDRPAARNALSEGVQRSLLEAPAWFAGRPDVSVVVVTGAGESFSAGADLGLIRALLTGEGSHADADLGRTMAAAVSAIDAVTVASIRGHCIGGGLVLAAACDLRVAAIGTVFQIPELDLGIPLGWTGVPVLVRELGPALATELVLTCRRATPDELAARGFLNRVVPGDRLDDEVDGLVAELAARPPSAVRTTLRSLRRARDRLVDPAEWTADAALLLEAFENPDSVAAARRRLAERGFG